MNAREQIGHAEVITLNPPNGIHPDNRNQQSNQNGKPTFPKRLGPHGCCDRETEKNECENLGRAKRRNCPIRNWRGGQHHYYSCHGAADSRTHYRRANGSARLAIFGHRIAIEGGWRVFRRPWDIKQNGGYGSAINPSTVNNGEQHNAVLCG